ncbi:hypothetical protein [Massilia sp. erpn]|uniref:hypothetical protein n=1 Tax=Massilia sp. erpn TaxID=2738142 RepID=UPI0021054CF9|nr:hypothetical protein [Massilia sp. erpn]UTY58821.1 hypothetical protein HPQ68_17465 [Massilia sp. erpn]
MEVIFSSAPMKKITVLVCLLLGFGGGYLLLKKEKKSVTISPSAEFNMTPQEISNLEVSARGGDCQAAYRLARYHSNFTLKFEDAIHWFRLAVKCPETNPKLELIALLMGYQDSAHMMEIRQLIQDLSRTDPSAAKRAEEAVTKAHVGGTDQ